MSHHVKMTDLTNVWLNRAGLFEQVKSWKPDRLGRLLGAWRLRFLIQGGLFVESLNAYQSLASLIEPSKHALDIVGRDRGLSEVPEEALKLGCFAAFYHRDILFDFDALDLQAIELEVNNLIRSRTLLYPPRFGRVLYNRFFDKFDAQQQDYLSFEETKDLLDGVEQGIYQSGDYLVGPMGLSVVEEFRYAPPSKSVPLWHCSNWLCGHLHDVVLSDADPIIRDTHHRLDEVALNYLGQSSHWGALFSEIERNIYPDNYGDLLAVVQEAFSELEARSLFADLLQNSSEKGRLWSSIAGTFGKKAANRQPTALASEFSIGTIYQLILTVDDDEIVEAIDRLISTGAIKVPPAEVRRAKQNLPDPPNVQTTSSVSALGIRTNSRNPAARLALAIWDGYDSEDRLTDLSWRTMKAAGPAVPSAVLEYLHDHTAADAVNELILSSRDITNEICQDICMRVPEAEDDPSLVSRMLWKLGFDIPRFGSQHADLIRLLDQFRDALLRCSEPLSTADREKIRSAGVNLFVELEGYLEELVGYNVWLLHRDHYFNEFRYNPAEAVASVAETVPIQEISEWSPGGRNTLGVLLAYLAASIEWMRSLTGATEAEERSVAEYPRFIGSTDDLFPFPKRAFWANCEALELERYIRSYSEVAAVFLRSGLAGIRNGLEHYRRPEEFPELDAMIACESRVRQAIDMSDLRRLFPKRWWLKFRRSNDSGQVTETFQDESARQFEIKYPSILVGVPEADFGEAVIIPHGNLLGQPNSTVLFIVREPSEYLRMWDNYPARRSSVDGAEADSSAKEVDVLRSD